MSKIRKLTHPCAWQMPSSANDLTAVTRWHVRGRAQHKTTAEITANHRKITVNHRKIHRIFSRILTKKIVGRQQNSLNRQAQTPRIAASHRANAVDGQYNVALNAEENVNASLFR
jgi:hypothetical protein